MVYSRALVLLSGGPGFKASTLLLVIFVTPIGSPEFKSSVKLCKEPTDLPPAGGLGFLTVLPLFEIFASFVSVAWL